ncbi:MAG: hypothetical protein M1823_003413 [Watsoniomyces obsoletus]|nr:MAG: hypothetical protein M1823_003413 [Watsoniomyces obsoletus]
MTRLTHNEPDRLVHSNLDQGLLLETDATVGIHVPAGWLHATFTIEAGFLTGITTVAAESIRVLSMNTICELIGDGNVRKHLAVYVRGLQTALASHNPKAIGDAIDGWHLMQPGLARLAMALHGLGNPGKKVKTTWENFLGKWALKYPEGGDTADFPPEDKVHCCCDFQDRAFPDHFRTVHLDPVFQ